MRDYTWDARAGQIYLGQGRRTPVPYGYFLLRPKQAILGSIYILGLGIILGVAGHKAYSL